MQLIPITYAEMIAEKIEGQRYLTLNDACNSVDLFYYDEVNQDPDDPDEVIFLSDVTQDIADISQDGEDSGFNFFKVVD